MAKTLIRENPNYLLKTIECSDEYFGSNSYGAMADRLLEEFQHKESIFHVRYEENQRSFQSLLPFTPKPVQVSALPIKKDGVYLITGGTGGLGFIFAEALSKKTSLKLVLTGRSEITEANRKKIETLKASGSEVLYIQMDISKQQEVEKGVHKINQTFGPIKGILHSAGILRDSMVFQKSIQDFEDVLAAKVRGTLNLDEATEKEPLDFFILFSSITALMGNPGQIDYSYANSFMDEYAQLRNDRGAKGHTVSINWHRSPITQDQRLTSHVKKTGNSSI